MIARLSRYSARYRTAHLLGAGRLYAIPAARCMAD